MSNLCSPLFSPNLSMETFQILSLPHLAFQEILREMGPREIIQFASSSKKYREIIRKMIPKSMKYSVEVVLEDKYSVSIQSAQGDKVKVTIPWTGKARSLKNTLEAVKKTCYTFNCSIGGFKINCLRHPKFFYDLTFWFQENQLPMSTFYFSGWHGRNSRGYDELNIFLNSLNVTDKFQMYHIPEMNFDFKGILKAKEVFIDCSGWFKIEHLMKMKHISRIELRLSSFSAEDVSLFLTSWKKGEFPNLRNVEIETTNMIVPTILSGFPPETVLKKSQPLEYINIANEKIQCNSKVQIRNDAGVLGTCVFRPREHSEIFFMSV